MYSTIVKNQLFFLAGKPVILGKINYSKLYNDHHLQIQNFNYNKVLEHYIFTTQIRFSKFALYIVSISTCQVQPFKKMTFEIFQVQK